MAEMLFTQEEKAHLTCKLCGKHSVHFVSRMLEYDRDEKCVRLLSLFLCDSCRTPVTVRQKIDEKCGGNCQCQ
jgi:hypothetical protein